MNFAATQSLEAFLQVFGEYARSPDNTTKKERKKVCLNGDFVQQFAALLIPVKAH